MAAAQSPSAPDIPALLRFLTQDAKLDLSKAMSAVKALQTAELASPTALASSNVNALGKIFSTPEEAKKVHNAAKRVTKHAASAPEAASTPGRGKKRKLSPSSDVPTPQELEESLALPEPVKDMEAIRQTILYTNRAPLLLAFAVVLLEFTMPRQPLSSRLSLAQGMVSTGAREKAVHLGLESGKSAEEEGFGMGQPVVRVMSKEIRILKRWGYDAKSGKRENGMGESDVKNEGNTSEEAKDVKEQDNDATDREATEDNEPALWALDLEALKKQNGPPIGGSGGDAGGLGNGLPIYTPQSARSYIYKSFASSQQSGGNAGASRAKKGKMDLDKERNLGLLLGALELLFESWAVTLSREEINKRAWSWYVAVRPDVEHGVAGWGGKGEVHLRRILDLRRNT